MPLAERDLNASEPAQAETPLAQKSHQPQTQLQSRLPLPRRAVTPSSASSRPQWSSRVASRIASAQKTADTARKLQSKRSGEVAVTPEPKDSETPTPFYTPALVDKPLPSRPIVQLSNLQSPSRDSRGLIDASEAPLQVMASPSGRKTQWPSLTPVSATSPSEELDPDETRTVEVKAQTTVTSPSATSPSATASATETTNVITGEDTSQTASTKHRSNSPTSSYASASENSPTPSVLPTIRDSISIRDSQDFSTPTHIIPSRSSSMRNRISSGSLIPQTAGSSRKFLTFTDFTRPGAVSPSQSDSHLHSPSPASFSRPRPGSTRLPTPDGSLKVVKTASRLPIPDAKKATVVDVKARSSQNSSSSTPKAPTFGNRRLDTKTADILDNGIRRRQLQRNHSKRSFRAPALQRSPTNASDATTVDTPTLSEGGASDAWDSSTTANKTPSKSEENLNYSEDDSEIATPSDWGFEGRKTRASTRQTSGGLSAGFRGSDLTNFLSAPPPTSPFTGLLQTIPSEAALPTHNADNEDATGASRTHTLTHLEGKGSPPKHDVDKQTLMQMFGHMRTTFDAKNTHASALAENAAAAEKFLAMQEKQALDMARDIPPQLAAELSTACQSLLGATELAAEVSKWSDSTTSELDNDLSLPELTFTPKPESNSLSKRPSRPPPPPPPKDSRTSPYSIGHISRMQNMSDTAGLIPSDGAAEAPEVLRRQSSPTLGPKQPGSIRSAREGLSVGPSSFARTTQAAEAKKTSRLPTPRAKTFSDQRGRQPSPFKPAVAGESTTSLKMPRARSKSRYVIDKLNGLFSHKRDKKSNEIPPVPRIPQAPGAGNAFGAPMENNLAVETTSKTSPKPNAPISPNATGVVPASDVTLCTTGANPSNISAVQSSASAAVETATEQLIGQAQRENNLSKKERILSLAQVLTDTLIHTREAQVSAESADHAARRAQMSYELTQKSLELLQRMAMRHVRTGV